MNNDEKLYTHNELRLALLEQSNIGISDTFKKIEEKFNRIDEKFNRIDEKFDRIDEKFDKLSAKIDSHFHWTMGAISALYVSLFGILITALTKSLNWF